MASSEFRRSKKRQKITNGAIAVSENDGAAAGKPTTAKRLNMKKDRLFTVPNSGTHPSLFPSDFPSAFPASLRHNRLFGSRSRRNAFNFGETGFVERQSEAASQEAGYCLQIEDFGSQI